MPLPLILGVGAGAILGLRQLERGIGAGVSKIFGKDPRTVAFEKAELGQRLTSTERSLILAAGRADMLRKSQATDASKLAELEAKLAPETSSDTAPSLFGGGAFQSFVPASYKSPFSGGTTG